jgi:hypothetical protein
MGFAGFAGPSMKIAKKLPFAILVGRRRRLPFEGERVSLFSVLVDCSFVSALIGCISGG